MSDRVFALIWLGVCVLVIFKISAIEVPFAYEPVGPKAFPLILAGLMILCCGALLVSPDSGIHWPETSMLAKGGLLIVALLVYAFFFEILGFPVSTVVMVLLVSRIFGGRWLGGIATALLFGILGYLLFDRVLEVSLPIGRIWS